MTPVKDNVRSNERFDNEQRSPINRNRSSNTTARASKARMTRNNHYNIPKAPNFLWNLYVFFLY